MHSPLHYRVVLMFLEQTMTIVKKQSLLFLFTKRESQGKDEAIENNSVIQVFCQHLKYYSPLTHSFKGLPETRGTPRMTVLSSW